MMNIIPSLIANSYSGSKCDIRDVVRVVAESCSVEAIANV